MSDKPPAPGPFTVASIAIDTWKTKVPFHFLPLPSEFFPAVGLVATHWGVFETLFENLLAAVVKASGHEGPWRNIALRKQISLLRNKSTQTWGNMPTTVKYLQSILADAIPLYQSRNLIFHGSAAMGFGAGAKGEQLILLECAGRYRGKELRDSFTADRLDDLFYEIGHLCGRLYSLSTASASLPLPSHERSQLQAFLQNNHPTYPNPSNLPPPP